jgi:DNA-directed RNA polymerase subunit RPC12/RpoP
MNEKPKKAYMGRCIDCGSLLELYEIDFDRNKRILQCTQCGLYHFYEKDFLGRWKLVKASKEIWKFR